MVSTRRQTDSLPAKKTTYAEEQAADAAAVRQKRLLKFDKKAIQEEISDTLNGYVQKSSSNPKPTVKTKTSTQPKAQTSRKATPGKLPSDAPSDAILQRPPCEGASKFLDLPPELRNDIYSYVLVYPGFITIRPEAPHVSEPALLAVNHQIRSEAVTVFYGENTFRINGSALITRFLRTAGEEKIRALRDVQIFCKPLKRLTRRFLGIMSQRFSSVNR